MEQEACNEELCGVCQRQCGRVFDLDNDLLSLVDYYGDYAVATTLAPEVTDMSTFIYLTMNDVIVPEFITTIGYVEEGSLRESRLTVSNDDFLRFVERHDDEDKIWDVHNMILDGLMGGVIHVSEPLTKKDLRAQFYPEDIFRNLLQ